MERIVGAVVQRVDVARVGGRDVAMLRARVPGETIFVLVAAGSGGGVASVDGDAREAAKAALRAVEERPVEARWRSVLDGMRIAKIGVRGVVLEKDGATKSVTRGAGGALVLGDEGDVGDALDDDAVALRAAALTEAIAAGAVHELRASLAKALGKAMAKVARRLDAIRGDLGRIDEAKSKADRAQLFVAEAARVPRGARSMSVVDWSSGEEKRVELALDPSKSAREQIDAIFKRARRLKDGARFGTQRLAEAEAAAARLRAIASSVEVAPDVAALEAATKHARAAAPRDFSLAASRPGGVAKKQSAEARAPHRTFHAASGAPIFVGRGADHNDALTFHVARPHDLWLHAKGRAGAHVVVPLSKGHACPAEVLVDAAHLAAHFSESRDETIVEIEHTPRRHLRKPRGSAPGFVIVGREKVMILRREDARLARLLATEEIAT